MSIIAYILGTYAFMVLCWVLYLAIMNLAEHFDRLHWFAKFNAYCIILPVGYAFDMILNVLMCAVFMRLPKDWLLTGTLKRMINTEAGWRVSAAGWICEHLLNPWDPKGKHC